MFDDNVTPPDPGGDIDPKTGNFIEKESSPEDREKMLKERITEFLESDLESVVAAQMESNPGENEPISVEFDIDNILSVGGSALSGAEIRVIQEMLKSQDAKEIFGENNAEFSFVHFGPSHSGDKNVLEIGIKISHEPPEVTPEVKLVRKRFENTCAYCNSPIVTEEDVPESLAGKWKKGKGKDKGREYRDWDYGEVECPTCKEKEGISHKVFLFHREWRETK